MASARDLRKKIRSIQNTRKITHTMEMVATSKAKRAQDRIKATSYFIEEALNFAHANADRLKQVVAAADAESTVGRAQATRAAIRTGGLI